MTKILYIFSLLCCLFSCRNQAEEAILQEARKIILDRPDSALVLLQQIPEPENLPTQTYADYALLMTEALDRNDYPLPDTLLRVAADYYLEKKDCPIQTARTCYYLGRFNAETGYIKEAQAYYIKGIEKLGGTKDERLKGLLYSYLGNLYREQCLYDEAILQHHKSYQYSQLIQRKEDIVFDLRNIGIDFSKQANPDSAIYYYLEALTIAKQYVPDNTLLIGSLYQDLAICYQQKKDYLKALYYSNLSYPYAPKEFISMNDLTRGSIFMDAQQLDSAFYYLNRSQHSVYKEIQKESYHKLYQLEKQKNNLKEAIHFNELYLIKKDSIEQILQTETLAKINKRYQYEQIIHKNDDLKIKLHKAKSNFYLGLFIFCITIIVCIYGYKSMKRKHKLIIKKTVQEIEKNKQTIAQKEEAIVSQRLIIEENKFLLEQQKTHLKQLQLDLNKTLEIIDQQDKDLFLIQNKDNLFRIELFKKTQAHERINLCITHSTQILNKKDELLIINTVNKFFSKFIQTINFNKNLTTGNVCFCCILKLYPELTTEQLAQIYNVSPRSIEQRKYRLKKELIGENPDISLSNFLAKI